MVIIYPIIICRHKAKCSTKKILMRLGRRNMCEYINNDMCLLAKMLCGKHLSHCMEDGVVNSYQ